jgi:hypothetical protein
MESALCAYATTVFADSRGACVYWESDSIAMYNEVFAASSGGTHPYLICNGFANSFPELANKTISVFDWGFSTGQTVNVDSILFVERNDTSNAGRS